MSNKEESLGEVRAVDRIEVMHMVASKRINDLDVGLKPKKPDTSKVKTLMEKSKKPAEYFLVLRGTRLRLEIRAGGTAFDLGDVDLDAEKDMARRRALLRSLQVHTALVSKADLDAFDKAHPAPLDPKKLEALKEEIRMALMQIKRVEGFKKTLPTSFKTMAEGEREVGFTNWARRLRLDRFIEFACGVEWGQDAKKLATEFIVDKAPRFLQIKPATRAAIEAAIAADKVPLLKPAHDEVVQIIDATMLPRYRKDTTAGIDAELAEERKRLALKQAELRAFLASSGR